MNSVLVGADPEVFLKSLSTNLPVSIIGKLGGTKQEGRKITTQGHSVLEDNCAAEFNIPPAADADQFVRDITFCLGFIDFEMRQKFNASLMDAASVQMPQSELEHPAAWVFGCEPDFNAWTGRTNPSPCSADITLRSAGGHVHIGFKNNPSKKEALNMIRAADIFLGLPSVELDKDTRRRELYGKAGAFRYKPYGAEYRTLSNFWIFSEELVRFVYEQTQRAAAYAKDNMISAKTEEAQLVQRAINTGDVGLSKELMKCYGVL
jgi:hypothetical protein